MLIRTVKESDYADIIRALNEWWSGRHTADMLPRLFFKHFNDTSFIVEEEDKTVAFLIGFISQTHPEQAYVHFLGVHPEYRKSGFASLLYEEFIKSVKSRGCDSVHLVTSLVNKNSIAFHTHIGFRIEEGDAMVDGVAVHKDYDGPEEDRVLFSKEI